MLLVTLCRLSPYDRVLVIALRLFIDVVLRSALLLSFINKPDMQGCNLDTYIEAVPQCEKGIMKEKGSYRKPKNSIC